MKIQEYIIRDLAKKKINSHIDLYKAKSRASRELKLGFPSNIDLLKSYHKLVKKRTVKKSETIEKLLRTSPVRSLSGIVNISVLTKPYFCPGECVFCPLEAGIPKSYVSGEPAVERAKALKYNPYLQTWQRLRMLFEEGHPIDKIELRIVGGTWSYYPKNYQDWFVKECFRACNDFSPKGTPKTKSETLRQYNTTTLKKLEKEQKINEKTNYRIVGLSIETRPDYIDITEIKQLRKLGITLVELGVQSIYDDVLSKNIRGHGIKSTILATKLLKNAGFKVLYQMMPDLPGTTPQKDVKMFEKLFSVSDFQPDLLKIYPCAVLKNAPLYKLWKKKLYKPYTEKQLTTIIKKIKSKIPYYVRIQRIIRDIPSPMILEGGVKLSNLRQELKNKSKNKNILCRCIRCREVKKDYDLKEKIFLFRQDYNASGSKEIFLSFENKERTKLFSLLRLRAPSNQDVFSVLQNTALIREIHTYGQLVPITKKGKSAQHKGFGKKLIKKAEQIARKEFKAKKIAAISGVGARQYWKKLGYKLQDTYLLKSF